MTPDPRSALDARDQWLYITRQWPALTKALAGRGGNALNGVKITHNPDPSAVIDIHVSDLLHELTTTTEFYARILMDETTWTPTTSAMPQLLVEVATRYGHFVTDPDDAMATGFMDDAHTYSERVRLTLEPPARPNYLGPCRTQNCEGELFIREDRDHARCPNCGTTTTRTEQAMWLQVELEDRLLTPTEIGRALKMLERPVTDRTIWRWIERGALIRDEDSGLYPLKQAITLAPRRSTAA
jgi:predicted RNA-binding Zn-ribbon protein involved in translation (DUF1610 family)